MPDIHGDYAQDLVAPPSQGEAIDYSVSDHAFANTTTKIHLSTGGTIVVRMSGMASDLTLILAAGWHDIRLTHIRNSGSSGAIGHGFW